MNWSEDSSIILFRYLILILLSPIILEKILKDDPDTKSDSREMVVFVDELAESAVIMGLRVWVATESYWAVKWRLNQKIKEEFDANGIVIPYNQMEVYVHQK